MNEPSCSRGGRGAVNTMFFIVAKLVWFVLQPSNLIAVLFVVGLATAMLGFRHCGFGIVSFAAIAYLVCGLTPLNALLLLPLEERFPPAEIDGPITGIIVLGGGLDQATSAMRGVTTLTDAGERYTEAVNLMRRHPEARLVFAGGIASLTPEGPTEADGARRFFSEMGLDATRITFEDRSRDTSENVQFSKELVDPKPGERWVLITSAWHMPRSIGAFRKAGWDVLAWPTDYRTAGWGDLTHIATTVSGNLVQVDLAAKEWVGLVAYYLGGRTDTLFPAP